VEEKYTVFECESLRNYMEALDLDGIILVRYNISKRKRVNCCGSR
jgi:hypothetical protein